MTQNPIVDFLKRNFMGATITLTLVTGQTITGELVDGFDNIIGIKAGAVITFVNAFYIVTFV